MYHRVGKPEMKSPVNGQYVSPAAFRRQMRLLDLLRVSVVGLDRVAMHVRGSVDLGARSLAITFDDGFANLYRFAFPQLEKRGYPATIFLITDYLGQKNTYHPKTEDLYEPLLSVEAVRSMQDQGIQFGSHTRRHARLTECDEASLRDEVRGSREVLASLLGAPPVAFCYPYGAENDRVRQEVISAGYDLACSTRKGRNNLGEDPYRLKRVNVRADTWLPVFGAKLLRARLLDR